MTEHASRIRPFSIQLIKIGYLGQKNKKFPRNSPFSNRQHSFQLNTMAFMLKEMFLIPIVLVLVAQGSATNPTDSSYVNEAYSTLVEDIAADRSLKKLSRTKRYMSFPEGSSFSVSLIFVQRPEES